MRVLFVHPDRLWRESYSRALWDLGFAVETAPGAAEARVQLTNLRVDVVVYGGEMPDVEAVLLAEEHWARNPDGAVVFISTARITESSDQRVRPVRDDDPTPARKLAILSPRRALSRLSRLLATWRDGVAAASFAVPSAMPSYRRVGS